MSKTHAPECQTSPDWDALHAEEEQSQQSIEPTTFFGCNPYGNAAQIEDVQTKLNAGLSSVAEGDAGKTDKPKTADQLFKEEAGFFTEVNEEGKPVMYPLASPITYTDAEGKEVKITELSGADLNLMGRAIFAEASGAQTVDDADTLQRERDAVGSVIMNRLGARGVRGGRQSTVQGVLEAKNQFQSVTGGESGKYQAAANADAWKAYHGKKDTAANMADLKASMDTVRGLLQTGPTVDYTSFVSSAYANSQGITKGTDIGNTRFWTDAEIKR